MIQLAAVPRLADLELSARRVVEGLYAGRHRSPYAGAAVEFADHRPYQPGDDLRLIDWRVAARRDTLLLRRHHEERDLPLALLLDTSASMAYGSPTKHDHARLAAAALGLLAIEQGDRLRLITDHSDDACTTPTALCAHLDRCPATGAAALAQLCDRAATRLRRRTLVVVFSDLLTDPALCGAALGRLAGRGHDLALIQVLDRSELALPADWGRCQLRDPEGQLPERACDASAVKDAYDAAMQDHLAACRRMAHAVQADHVLLPTDVSVAQVLGDWLRRRVTR
jgi:uncharacterized protein (DUF58 family)